MALILASLYLVSRTRFYAPVRLIGAGVALAAATGWAHDRLGVLANPLAGVDATVIAHPWYVVVGLAAVAGPARSPTGGRPPPRRPRARGEPPKPPYRSVTEGSHATGAPGPAAIMLRWWTI